MLAALLALCLSSPVRAAAPEFVLQADVAGSYWDEGFKVAAYPGVQWRLWGEDGSLLFGDTFLKLDAVAEVTPSYARLGPRLTFSPIAVFEMSGHFLPSAYFGTFSSVKGFDDPATVYTDAVLDASPRDSGLGYVWGGDATLRGKVGPVIVASWAELRGWQLKPGDAVVGDYWWEPQSELLIGMTDQTWSINGVLLYEQVFDVAGFEPGDRKLYAGAMFNRSSAVGTGDTFMRLGPMVNFQLNPSWAFLVLVQAYLDDRIYTDPLPPYIGARVRWTMQRDG